MKPQPYRYRRYGISFPLLQAIMTEGWETHSRCVTGLPEGARLVHTYINESETIPTVYLVFEHESFDSLPAGSFVPAYFSAHEDTACAPDPAKAR